LVLWYDGGEGEFGYCSYYLADIDIPVYEGLGFTIGRVLDADIETSPIVSASEKEEYYRQKELMRSPDPLKYFISPKN